MVDLRALACSCSSMSPILDVKERLSPCYLLQGYTLSNLLFEPSKKSWSGVEILLTYTSRVTFQNFMFHSGESAIISIMFLKLLSTASYTDKLALRSQTVPLLWSTLLRKVSINVSVIPWYLAVAWKHRKPPIRSPPALVNSREIIFSQINFASDRNKKECTTHTDTHTVVILWNCFVRFIYYTQ